MTALRRALTLLAATTAALTATTPLLPLATAADWPMPPVPAGPFAPPSAGQLAALRSCEASGNYAIDTGNGYYGAYQFSAGTWEGLGFPGTANQAPPDVQDRAATIEEVMHGWQPWPSCSARLGLTTERASALATATAEPAWTVGARLTETTVASQHPTELEGHVVGAPAGLTIAEQVYRDGNWQTMATTPAESGTGDFWFTMRPGPAGVLLVRVLVAPTADHEQTPTGALPLTVTAG